MKYLSLSFNNISNKALYKICIEYLYNIYKNE